MNWNTVGEFFAMGGYALYVWGSLIVTFALLLGELLQLRCRTQAIRDEIVWSSRALTQEGERQP